MNNPTVLCYSHTSRGKDHDPSAILVPSLIKVTLFMCAQNTTHTLLNICKILLFILNHQISALPKEENVIQDKTHNEKRTK